MRQLILQVFLILAAIVRELVKMIDFIFKFYRGDIGNFAECTCVSNSMNMFNEYHSVSQNILMRHNLIIISLQICFLHAISQTRK